MSTPRSTCRDLGIVSLRADIVTVSRLETRFLLRAVIPKPTTAPLLLCLFSIAIHAFRKKKTTPSENIFLLLLSPVEEKHLAHSAKRLFFPERSRFLQTEGFAQNELLLIAIKLRQSTAEETEGCPLDPIQSKPVLTPAVPYLYCSVSLLCCTKSALNVIYLALHQERGPAAKLAAEATNLSHIAMVANLRLDS